MLHKFLGLLAMIGVACMVSTCKKSSSAKSYEAQCKDECKKLYDDCGEEYMDSEDADEDELEDLLDDCNDECEDAAEDAEDEKALYDCMAKVAPKECRYDLSSDYQKYADCLLDADCDDYIDWQLAWGDDPCEDEYDDYSDAVAEAEEECNDAVSDLDEDELEELQDAMDECEDEYGKK